MKVFNTETINYNDFKHEITQGSGVIVIKDVYSKEQISSAREVINNLQKIKKPKKHILMPRLKHPVKFICSREFGIYLVKIKFSVN